MSSFGLLPLSLVLLAAATFVVSYIVAVVRGDVSAAFPYISDTGAEIPESCIFGQFLNISAFLSLITVYIRYKVVTTLCSEEDRKTLIANKIALFFGLGSSLGCSMVANFQEGTVVEPVHFTGAFLVFGFGIIYTFIHTYISYLMHPDYNGLYVCRVRLSIALVALVGFVVTIVAGGISRFQWNEVNPNKSRFKWNVTDPGYTAHVISTVGEWLTAITFLFYFFTYVRDFNKFEVQLHARPLVRHLDEEPYMFEPRSTSYSAEEHAPLLASQPSLA